MHLSLQAALSAALLVIQVDGQVVWQSASAVTPTTLLTATLPKPSSDVTLSPDQQTALDLHNVFRNEVGCGNLTWDAGLASDAQDWANHLTVVRSLQHSNVQATQQGENLFYQYGTPEPPYTNAAQWWLDEKKIYNGQPIPQGDFHAYGHYSQCVWKTTTKVGMALATDSKGITWVVARYTPIGNIYGQTPF